MSAERLGSSEPPLIAHVIFRLAVGGLENGLINLINLIPEDRYRHAIVCIKDATSFRQRIERPSVPILELKKKDGKDPLVYWRMWLALRKLRPDVIHTRNANAIEFQLIAALAGIRYRVHGEHGWDLHDIDGSSRKYRMLRKTLSPLVHRFIAVSQDLEHYLLNSVGVSASKVSQIVNGVDFTKFRRDAQACSQLPWQRKARDDLIIIGTVGRMQAVKNPKLLVRAFLRILELEPNLRSRLRLLMVGDGPLRAELMRTLKEHGVAELAWLPGARDDVATLLAQMDIFVLPSINEGISNTILEAMALGIPVVATRVGGNEEIVSESKTGALVAVDDIDEMAAAIIRYTLNPELRLEQGNAARKIIEEQYSLKQMVRKYLQVYDGLVRLSEPAEQSRVT